MSRTSAIFTEVWPPTQTPPTAVSARIAHVVNREEGEPSHVRVLLDAMHQEMTQRTHLFIVVLMVITVVMMQRIRRLEHRLMVHSMGALPPRHWW